MADKKLRTLEEIKREYTNICVQAGHLQYQIATLKTDLANINSTLKDLNLEGAAAEAAESAAKAKEVSNA